MMGLLFDPGTLFIILLLVTYVASIVLANRFAGEEHFDREEFWSTSLKEKAAYRLSRPSIQGGLLYMLAFYSFLAGQMTAQHSWDVFAWLLPVLSAAVMFVLIIGQGYSYRLRKSRNKDAEVMSSHIASK